MVSKVFSGAVFGVEAFLLTVEADMFSSLPGIDIVGLADTAVKESKERIKAALKNSGFAMPQKRIVINLAPASTKNIAGNNHCGKALFARLLSTNALASR